MPGRRLRLRPFVAQQQHAAASSGLISLQSGQVLARTLAATAARLLPTTVMSTELTGPCRRQLPAKSRIRELTLPSALRVPRPTICT